ncbi:Uncharacterised protein [Mycobacteroides abscessus subsp. abscessus]|uniref:Uncharacterized protein n=1 Tax=Gordonia aichiensis NBRC 108223 TaxID=1220583 RepID=L7KQK5_9ACTN|nr:hypothetical protein GOACH_53_00020 [Gordonia aichiensis NBRC 108223]SKZ91455.1 Uncharacterised protein [Mycobacteroides abscessus subsp. abscessus]
MRVTAAAGYAAAVTCCRVDPPVLAEAWTDVVCRRTLPTRQGSEVSLRRGEEYKDGGQGDEVGQGPP